MSKIFHLILAALLGGMLSGIAAAKPRQVRDPLNTYHMTLAPLPDTADTDEGKKELSACLNAFDQGLHNALGKKSSFEANFIACEGCDKLGSAQPPRKLAFTFLREHTQHFANFGKAWNYVQSQKDSSGMVGHPICQMTFDALEGDQPSCVLNPPKPCFTNPLCVNYNPARCSRNDPQLGGPCQSCLP